MSLSSMEHMHKPELLLISAFVKCYPPKVPDEKQDTAYKKNGKNNQAAAEKAL